MKIHCSEQCQFGLVTSGDDFKLVVFSEELKHRTLNHHTAEKVYLNSFKST